MKNKIIILLIVFVFNFSLFAKELPEDLKLGTKRGLDAIYSIDLEKAEKEFNNLVKEYPAHPFGNFGLAMTKWAEFEYLEDESNPSLNEEYINLTDKAINIGNKWLKENPDDAYAYLAMGGMYGLKARLLSMQHSWIKAYFSAKKAISNMKKALKINPQMYDAYLGLGMYEYYTGTLPTIIRWLSKVLVNGNPKKGIEYLELCKDKGYFNNIAAELILIEIFTENKGKFSNPSYAVKMAKELRKIYPNHAQMHFVEIVSLYENKNYDEAEKEMFTYLSKIGKDPHYKEKYLPRIYVSLGIIFMIKKDYDNALFYFQKAKEIIKKEKNPSRWAVWAIVRIGNVYDIKGNREKAIKYYKEALTYKDNWGFKEFIENFIKIPFNPIVMPDRLSPP